MLTPILGVLFLLSLVVAATFFVLWRAERFVNKRMRPKPNATNFTDDEVIEMVGEAFHRGVKFANANRKRLRVVDVDEPSAEILHLPEPTGAPLHSA